MQLALVLCWWILDAVASAEEEGYYCKLPDLRTSEGTWDVPFDPDRSSYHVRLSSEATEVTIEAVVDFARYVSPEDYPVLAIDGKERHYGSNDLIADTIQVGQARGSWSKDVAVQLKQPVDKAPATNTYWLHLAQRADLDELLTARTLSLRDDMGNAVALNPAFNASARVYQASVVPAVKRVQITFACDPLAEAEVMGETVPQGQPIWVDVQSRQRTTLLRAACVYGSDRRTMQVSIYEKADLSKLAANLEILVLGSEGKIRRTGNAAFVVDATAPSVELVPVYSDARIALRLEVPGSSNLTLGPGIPTPSLTVPPNGSRTVRLVLLSHADSLPIAVQLQRSHAPSQGGSEGRTQPWSPTNLGWLVSALVGGCVVFNSLVTSLSTALGRGAPLDSSASLRSLVLLLQFVSLGNVVAGPSPMADFAKALRGLCLLPPIDILPFGGLLETLLGKVAAAADVHLRDKLEALLGLAMCLLLLAAVAAVHLLVLAVRLCCGWSRASPHSLCLGTWEVRCLQYIAYPASCLGSVLLLSQRGDSGWLRAVACASLLVPLLVGLGASLLVRRALRLRLVSWVSEEFTSGGTPDAWEDGQPGGGWGGRFLDAECDQICTLPQDRCCLPGLPLRWATTAARIRPQRLSALQGTAGAAGAVEDEFTSDSEGEGKDSHQLLLPRSGSSTAVVEVLSTCTSCSSGCCRPPADVGLFAGVGWLEALLSLDDLNQLHRQAQTPAARQREPMTPVEVEVLQLQGPLTSGRLSFCFDGMRWPQHPPLELILRPVLGLLSALATTQPGLQNLALLACGCLAGAWPAACAGSPGGFFAVAFLKAPCSSFGENAALLLTQLGLTLTASAYLGHSVGALPGEVCGYVVMVCSVGAMAPVVLYAVLRTLALCCAACASACCTSKQERESKRGCNVSLALHWPNDTELLVLPARCRVPINSFSVRADACGVRSERWPRGGKRPRLEFPVLDYIARVDRLDPPRALLTGPSQTEEGYSTLGYKFEAIYEDEEPESIISTFVERSVGIDLAARVVPEVRAIFASHSAPGFILAMQLIAPMPDEVAGNCAFSCCDTGGQWSASSSESESEESYRGGPLLAIAPAG